ncbi:uncharacterized protein LOC117290773 isoform X1 [Asterias rubens]|uniref:uncharacterized protein LOC117290773 isoform X1 n=1 Tax=Asterias rubens TaxID=7604 RepID=UPI0014552598|nr:uncharacterized protein LOC117290773 isoform X1 [Asterias rubens]
MFRQYFVTCFIAILILFETTDSQDIQGRVNLGSDGNSTTSPTDFFFTLNVNSGTLPLNFDLYNVTDGSNATGVAFDEDVTVSCAITTVFTEGDSVLQFTDAVIELRNGVTVGDAPFDIVSQGRQVEVQCRGETTTPGLTSYFSLNTSAGQTGHVTIKKSPVLSLCQERIFVANSNGITRGQLNLQLSEPVQGSNVTAQCDVTGITSVGMVVWLSFDIVSILIDQDSATMPYDITGRGDTLQVTCYAESDDDVQYQRSSSSSDILFDFEMGSVTLLPATSRVTSNKFTPLLVLAEPLQPGDDEVTFLCTLTQLNSTDEVQSFLDRAECTVPESGLATTPNPTAGPTPAMTTSTNTSNSTLPTNATQPITTTPQITTPQPTTPPLLTLPPTTPLPTTQSPTFPVPTTPPGNVSSEWKLAESEIVFQEGDMELALLVSRSGSRDGYQGVLLVTCCAAKELNTSPKYSGLITAVVATVDVPPARSINWTAASDVSQPQTERVITNPAYTEVSPCPCDLTSNKCDVNCCCDSLCSEEDQTAFICIPGIPGGNFTIQDDYNCKTQAIFKSDWSPFLCVETDNSPYLGYYFSSRPGTRNAASFNALKATTPQTTSFEDTEQRSLEFQDEDTNAGGYKFGFPVETLFKTSVRGFLALPQVDSNGGCSWLSPIRFQMGTSSSCDVDPKEDLCVDSSVLSARAFTLSSNAAYPPCSEAPGILRSYGGINPAPTSVRYYCTDDITAYLVSGLRIEELVSPNQESLFPDGSSNATFALPDRCSWDDGFTLPPVPQYNNQTSLCSNVVLDVRYELFWRGNQIVQADASVILGVAGLALVGTKASTDDDEDVTFVTPPTTPVPTMEVTMEGTEIVTLIEDVTDIITMLGTDPETFGTIDPTTQMLTTLAPTTQPPTLPPTTTPAQPMTTPAIPVTTSDFTTSSMTTGSTIVVERYPALPFTQHFSVKFTHLSTPISDPAPIDPPDVSDQVERSGNPGYIIGRRVLSGVAVYDPQTECNNESLCATVEPVQFSDFVRVDDAETNRLRVWAPGPGSLCSQSSLVDVTYGEDHVSGCILRLGWSQVSNCSALRETMLMEFLSMMAADRIGKTGNASTTMLRNWAPVFKPVEQPLPTDPPPVTAAVTTDAMTTADMTTSEEQNETLEYRPLDLGQGVCYDVPTGVNLEILYANTGEFGGLVQQEILSARINFSKSTIKFQCSGANSVTCHLNQASDNATEWVQSFPVTSTVVFTRVPAEDLGPGYLLSGPIRCDNDQCFEEMYFPFSPRFKGDSPQYTIGVALFLVLLTIGYVAFTRL